jgi:hypothetical protein
MRGPDSVPWYTLWDEGEPEQEPILMTVCPCCKGLDEAFGTRACLTYARVLTRELACFLSKGDVPLHGVSGWSNQGLEAANTPGCLRCGDAGVVPVGQDTEEEL